MNEEVKEQHKTEQPKKKNKTKIVGFTMLGTGFLCLILGFIFLFATDSFLWILTVMAIPLMFGSIGVISIGFQKDMVKKARSNIAPLIRELRGELHQTVDGIFCTYCGAENDGNSNFCKECGKPLHKSCKNCGAIISDDSKFCNQCGKSLE